MKKLVSTVGGRIGLALAGLKKDEGQTFVEYAMILALIGVALVGALTFLHDQIAAAYTTIANAI